MLAATLTKDQWWFVVVMGVAQAVVTLGAVYLGARWALSRDSRVRREARSEQAATASASILRRAGAPLEGVMVRLLELEAQDDWARSQRESGDQAEVTTAASRDEVATAASELFSNIYYDDAWSEAAYLQDSDLREGVRSVRDDMWELSLRYYWKFDAVFVETIRAIKVFIEELADALERSVRGEPYRAPARPDSWRRPLLRLDQE